jgi:hypothetical protein
MFKNPQQVHDFTVVGASFESKNNRSYFKIQIKVDGKTDITKTALKNDSDKFHQFMECIGIDNVHGVAPKDVINKRGRLLAISGGDYFAITAWKRYNKHYRGTKPC